MIAAGYSARMDGSESADIVQTRRLRRVAVTAGITLLVLIVLAVLVYVGVFVILSPMMG